MLWTNSTTVDTLIPTIFSNTLVAFLSKITLSKNKIVSPSYPLQTVNDLSVVNLLKARIMRVGVPPFAAYFHGMVC